MAKGGVRRAPVSRRSAIALARTWTASASAVRREKCADAGVGVAVELGDLVHARAHVPSSSMTAMRAERSGPDADVEVLLDGLVFGEQPRWHDDRLWFSDWGTHEVIAVDLEGKSEIVLRGTLVSAMRRLAARRPAVGRLSEGGPASPPGAGRLARDPRRPGQRSDPPAANELVVDGRGNAYVNGGRLRPVAGEDFAPGISRWSPPTARLARSPTASRSQTAC